MATGDQQNQSKPSAQFTSLSNPGRVPKDKRLQASFADTKFQLQLREQMEARLTHLAKDLVWTYGPEQAARIWKAFEPKVPKRSRGAPPGSRDPERDRALLFRYRLLELEYPSLSPTALRKKCAELVYREGSGHSIEALEGMLRVLTTGVKQEEKPNLNR